MVDGTCLISQEFVHGAPKHVFPRAFDLVDGMWRVSLSYFVHRDPIAIPEMLVFLWIFDMVDGMCLAFPGFCSRCSKDVCFPRDLGLGGWNLASFAQLFCSS